MDAQTPTDLETHQVRPARARDLGLLASIEDSGAGQFRELFGADLAPVLVQPATSGSDRAARAGFVLVAGEPPIGFVHVLLIDAHAHLEQVSVRPEHQRRGIGAALVRAAMARARQEGHDRLSLCTYRDVPWNGPFYRSLGFTEVSDLAPYQQDLRETERALGLDLDGVRCVMEVALR